MPRGALSLGLRLAVTVSLLLLLVLFVAEPARILQILGQLQPVPLLLAVGLVAGDRVVMAYKWWLLLSAMGLQVSLWRAIRAYFVASFVGLFLPVTVGADAARVLALRPHSSVEVTASIIVERVLGMLAMASVALVSTGLFGLALTGRAVGPFVFGVLIVAVVGLTGFVASLFVAGRGFRFSGRLALLGKVADAYGRYRQRPGLLAVFYLLSVGESLLASVLAYTVSFALGFTIPLWVFIATMPLALTVARLPISFGGFGVQEVSFVYLAGLLGVANTDSLMIMLGADAVLILTLLPASFDVASLNPRRQAEA